MADEIVQRARAGNKEAIVAALRGCDVHEDIIAQISASWKRGRTRDDAAFANRVAARKHYVKRGWQAISKAERISELVDKFGLCLNVAEHLANGNGYKAEREEARRQLDAEDEESNE